MKVSVVQKSEQMITCMVELKNDGRSFMCSVVYAKNSLEERKKLWEDMLGVKNNSPWIILGDFNCIRFSHEKLGGENSNSTAVEEFNECLNDAEVEDLTWWGQKYTWWNKQEGKGKIECKLDRVLVNSEWNANFPCSDADFLLPGVSDHSPCVVDTGERKDSRPKPFRFFYMCTHHVDFLEVVKEAWEIPVSGDPLFKVVQKLKSVKMRLKKWNIETFGRMNRKVDRLRSQMFQIQDARRMTNGDGILARKEKGVTREYIEALKLEEDMRLGRRQEFNG